MNLKSRTLKNVARAEGWNALIEAASGLCPASVVARLLAAGADPNIRTSSGDTALMSLVDPRTIEGLDKARVLVSAGADVNVLNNDGQTALMIAASKGNAELIRFFGASDTDINRKNRSFGASPLIQGASTGSVETVQVLLDLGADLEARDNEGRTALMYAASNGTDDVVTLCSRPVPTPARSIRWKNRAQYCRCTGMADYRLRLETLGVASIEQRTLKARSLEQIAAGGFQPAEQPGQELTSCLPSTTTMCRRIEPSDGPCGLRYATQAHSRDASLAPGSRHSEPRYARRPGDSVGFQAAMA